ncbi:toxin [Streptomyces sp. NPDC005271]|uniref:toxin n=1 Tax=unclassified Streptomyces TaxID=2593676 RepID=UPI0033BEF797
MIRRDKSEWRRPRDLRGLRRWARTLVESLDLPSPCDLQTLRDKVSAEHDRPIRLVPMAMHGSGLSGLWLETDDADLVIYEATTGAQHRNHIIAHEFSHILCGHNSTEALSDQAAKLFFPDLDPGMVRRMLGRGGYANRDEQEAEIVATIMLERLGRGDPGPPDTLPSAQADVLARIQKSLRRT